jgi:hypothetical protein
MILSHVTDIFIVMRKHKLNENFFDEIDSEEKAYFLGFLYADGCNLLHRNRISLSIHEKDYEILKKLNDLIYEKNTIKITKNDINKITHFINGKSVRFTGNTASLIINSKHISSLLNNIGMTPKKSLTLKFPEWLNPMLYNHFIRGYFDGDGSIMKMTNKNISFRVKIASSEFFCRTLKDIIQSNLNIKIGGEFIQNKMSTIKTSGIYSTKILCDWLYKDSKIHMNRKYKLYQQLLSRAEKLHRAKYKYIYNNKKNGMWIADVYLGNKKSIRLGDSFPTEIDAYNTQQKYIKSTFIDK